ncbi:MmgE/PrpD family protein [Amycolatopsis sp. Poz14]|uniref:MmgE/PrpD family protein n=1 Tax=Amycolatopsis sp. Poz14 TaxID=1447705 RepID=UPI001EE951E6|nr:MmgE/PrpD family protein [Amycolatopsis sp. Poz14]MCG3753978.1 MmgE/PrpD family protein [Amycolatopsis sp. Poz14]
MTTSLAEDLVATVTAVDATRLPHSARDAVLRNSLQIFGVMRLGLQNPVARTAVEYVAQYEPGHTATVVAHGFRSATPAGAAFANAAASHGDFREDTHAESSSHPGVVVFPAILAAAEALGGNLPAGRFIEAAVAGHEMIGRLGGAAAMPTIERGFRPPSVYTLFGGTVAAGMILGLTPEQHVHALAVASQGAAGLNHPFFAGTDEWFLAPAFAARHAVTSAFLAQAGAEGSRFALEGGDGVLAAFAGRPVDIDLSPLGSRPCEIERTRLKAALTCGWNQSLVNQLRELAPDAHSVASVVVRMSPIAAEYPGVAKTDGFTNFSEALLSAPFASALQLVRGSLDHTGYAKLDDPELLDVAGRVTVETAPELDGYATTVDLRLADGKTLRSRDGNDNPRFSLDTAGQVLDTLRRNYISAGENPAAVGPLATALGSLADAGEVAPLSEALGEEKP